MTRTGLALRQRLEMRAARAVPLLSPRLQVRLSGRPPVVIDGQRLAPDIQLILAGLERRGRPPYDELPLEDARAEMTRGAIVGGGRPDPEIPTTPVTVDGGGGPLPARLYRTPELGGPHPLIVFLHGGGFVLGDLDSHDVPCRLLARHAGAHVLAVDYRLAPEHPFPAPVEDAVAAFRWACRHAGELGADPARVAIGGDSAGGNLAAVVSRLAAREGEQLPALQLLIYPATELERRSRSHDLFDEGFLLIRRDMDWFGRQYRGGHDAADPRLSILRAADLSGLPPALLITAGFDPLRDEGEAYAERLVQAGVPVLRRRFPGLIHGFLNMTGVSRSSREAVVEIAGVTRALLRPAPDWQPPQRGPEGPALEALAAHPT